MEYGFVGVLVFIVVLLVGLAVLIAPIILMMYVVKALKKYIRSKEVRQEKNLIKRTLGEVLKAHREACKMTQEFVAEAIGVSRQAVSKWENGSSDPSTSNLIALAKLYQISVEELLKEVE